MFRKVFLSVVIAVVGAFGLVVNSKAQLILLSSDSNIINPLTGSDGSVLNSGNQQFFINILRGGHTVLDLAGYRPKGSASTWDDDITSFYNTLPGVTASIFTGTITGAQLAGVDLFIAALPDSQFTTGEITALQSFLGAGGTVFFMGDNYTLSNNNHYVNLALNALSSSMSISNSGFDSGWHTGTGSQIAADPLTAGVTSFTYAGVSQVNGGVALFSATGDQPFVAYEVPEPSTILLCSVGGLTLLGVRLCRRK